MNILVINGPNLNLLGIREPEIYGTGTYEELCRFLSENALERNITLEIFQSNHEGAIVDKIQEAYFSGTDGIIINPAAYTHTSIAIADALKAVRIPFVEVHLSAVEERESFRRISYLKPFAAKTITGRGFDGYADAMDALAEAISS